MAKKIETPEAPAETPAPSTAPPPEAPAEPAVALVKMIRESADGPTEADVHPDEVGNYQLGGWQLA
jgi:hypothetical protein